MIDMHSMLSSGTVLINSVEFRHTETRVSTVTIYTSDGSYIDRATRSEEWVVVNSTEIEIGGRKGGYSTTSSKYQLA